MPIVETEYELYCNDEFVTGASGAPSDAWQEILRYFHQYQQDGDCIIYKVTREKIVTNAIRMDTGTEPTSEAAA